MKLLLHILFFILATTSVAQVNAPVTPAVVGGKTTLVNNISIVRDTSVDGVLLEWFGFTYGNGLTTLTQVANYDAWIDACEYAAANNTFVSVAAMPFEMYAYDGATVTVPAGQTLRIVGAGRLLSRGIIFPHVKTEPFEIFTIPSSGNITIQGISFETTPYTLETYDVNILSTTQIDVTDTPLRAAFLGTVDTIYVTKGNTQVAERAIVASVAGTVLTLTTALDTTGTGVGKIGALWATNTPFDTIARYGEKWKNDNIINYFLKVGGATDSTAAFISTLDMQLLKFDNCIEVSGTRHLSTVENSYISANIVGFGRFSNNLKKCEVDFLNTTFEDNGFVVYGVFPGSAPESPAPYGAGFYGHDNITVNAVNSKWINNPTSAFRQRASDEKPVDALQITRLVNCTFYNNDDYNIYTSHGMPTLISNTSFADGNVICGLNTNFNNCIFDSIVFGNADKADSIKVKFTGGSWTNTYSNLNGFKVKEFALEGVNITPHPTQITINTQGINSVSLDKVTVNAASSANPFFNYILPNRMLISNSTLGNIASSYFFRTSIDVFFNDTLYPVQDRIKITDCIVDGILCNANQISSSQVFDVQNTKFNNTIIETEFPDNFLSPNDLYRATITPLSKSYDGYSSALTWELDPNYNAFKIDSTSKRALFIKNSTRPVRAYQGTYTFIPSDTVVITAFNSSTETASNFLFAGTFTKPFQVYYDPNITLASGTSSVTNDTVFTLSTALLQADFENLGSTKIVPGSVSITASGFTFVDDGANNLSSSGGYGWIDYEKKYVILNFYSAPSVGPVIANYDEYNTVYSRGAFYKINE